MNSVVLENAFLESLVAGLPRSSHQRNGLQESDAELVSLPGGLLLAVTTDALVEEIESGLYRDPYQIGWMTVLVNASDLAAVGAEPLGLLLNQTFPLHPETGYVERLQAGVADACRAAGLAVLGGDTSFGSRPQMAAVALGLVPGSNVLTRKGSRSGDLLFASGPLGGGAAYALGALGGGAPGLLPRFLPAPRIREGQLVRSYASAAIDTSDGLLAGLDQLVRLNDVGVSLDLDPASMLDGGAAILAEATGVPPWFFLAGPHGEFELLFSVPASRSERFRAEARLLGWEPLVLGRVTSEPGVRMCLDGSRSVILDTLAVRNLGDRCGTDPRRYLEALYRIHESHHREREGSRS
jgi:thiamine-monophosphate kinase